MIFQRCQKVLLWSKGLRKGLLCFGLNEVCYPSTIFYEQKTKANSEFTAFNYFVQNKISLCSSNINIQIPHSYVYQQQGPLLYNL